MTRATTRVAMLWLILAVAAVAALVRAPPASAHATVTSSSPVDGADLTAPPTTVAITFDEAVGLDPGYLQVVDGAGARVDRGAPRHTGGNGATIAVDLRPGLPPRGGYLASYRVVSADGHPVGGTIAFTVGGGTPVAPPATAATPPGSSSLLGAFIDVGTALAYLGLTLAGGAWLVISRRAGVLDSRRARTVIRIGLLLAIAGAVITVLLQGPYVAGGDTSTSAGALLTDTLTSPFGIAHLIELAALGVLLLLSAPIGRMSGPLQQRSIVLIGLAVATWLVTLGAVAAGGHARVRSPVWLDFPSTVLHLVAVTTWVGGVVLLLALTVPHADPAATVLVRRLSRVALVSVVIIVVTGVIQAWLETASWAALFATTYGALVVVKAALLLVLVGLGALARRRLRGANPVRAVRPGVAVECGVMVVVLAVTSVLVAQPPARTAYAAELATRPASTTVTFDAARSAVVTADPAHHGAVDIDLTLRGVAEVDSVTMTASLPARSVGPIPVMLNWRGGPRFQAAGLLLPETGTWMFQVTLRTSRFDAVVAVAQLTIT